MLLFSTDNGVVKLALTFAQDAKWKITSGWTSCNTDKIDHGVHTVCAKVSTKFLEWAKTAGNDLITPHPEFNFPGLKEGDSWCVCAGTYAQSINAGTACKIYLKKTNYKTLEVIPLDKLKKYAIDLS